MRMDLSRLRVTGAETAFSRRGGLLEFPLPHGVVSAHVRHGDKGSVMRLVDFGDYVAKAEDLKRNAPFHLRRALFVSSEDSAVFTNASSPAAMLGSWASLWYDFPMANEGGLEQMRLLEKEAPRGRLVRFHFLALLMHLECDAWVGTRASNWCRLIDELRSVWVDKHSHPFAEVGDLSLHHNTYFW
jgi:hypothetical protein